MTRYGGLTALSVVALEGPWPSCTWQTLNPWFSVITLGQDPEWSLEAPLRKPSHFPRLCLARTHFTS